MEDYPTEPASEETKPNKRKYLRGNFLATWLKKRNLEVDKPLDEEDQEETEEKPEKAKKTESLPEIVSRRFRKAFRSIVGINEVKPAPAEDAKINYQEDQQGTSEQAWDKYEVETDEVKLSKPHDESDQPKTTAEVEYSGILPVSEDAVKRYKTDPETVELSTVPLEIPAPVMAEQHAYSDDAYNLESNRSKEATAIYTLSERKYSGASSTAEILRSRREKKLRKDVQKIKKQAKSIIREQHEIKDQQDKFSLELEQKYTQLKPESQTSRSLNLQTETLKQPAQEENFPALAIEKNKDRIRTRQEMAGPIQEEKLKEIVKTEEQYKPETILQTVEKAAEQNVAIENLYERRHEVKDEQDAAQMAAGQAFVDYLRQNIPMQRRYAYDQRPVPFERPSSNLSQYTAQDSELIKQAAKGGAISGIVLVIIMAIIMAYIF